MAVFPGLGWLLAGVAALVALGLAWYWLINVTEGVFLGRRIVVWLYDQTARKYDGIKQFDPELERYFLIHPFLVRLGSGPAPRVLDVATGTGRMPLFLLNEPAFHGRIFGLDASAGMLAQARPKLVPFGDRTCMIQQTADALPFARNVFDAVTCLEALEFFPSDQEALVEMVRVLRPGGLLLVTRRRGWEGKAFLHRFRSREAFVSLLQSMGLVDVESMPWQVDYEQVYARKRPS